jgi:hypothetical protein
MSKGRSNIPKTPPATCKALPAVDPIVLNETMSPTYFGKNLIILLL